MINHKWNLQLFAEGGGDAGAAAPGGDGAAAPAAAPSGVQEQGLRPAEQRQLIRSGQLKKSSAAPAPGGNRGGNC